MARSGIAGSVALMVLVVTPAMAATFHVDNGCGSCSDTGPGTPSIPYCTITAALTAHHDPGTTILVMPGVYREQLTVPGSGGPEAPISILGLGQPGNRVVISGADDFADRALWSPFSGNVWRAAGVTWHPGQVFADSVRLADSTITPALLPRGCFEWVSGQGLYVNVGGDNPGSHHAEVGRRESCFYVAGRSWVTVDGFTAARSEGPSIRLLAGCSNVAITNNVVGTSGSWGIVVNGCTAVRVASNTVSDNRLHGIGLTGGTSGSTVEDNESFGNLYPPERKANGLYCYSATGNLIQRNRFHHNQDSGEQLSPGSNDNISLQNESWSNGDHGYDNLDVTGNVHLGDVAWGNHKDGFSIEGRSPGQVLHDCIATDNGLTTNEFDLWVDSTSSVGFVSDDNLFWNSTAQPPVKYIRAVFSSVSIYSAASGQDSRTIQANPRFVDPAGGDFRLLEGSPAIDSGNSGLPDWPALDAAGNPRFDDPAAPNTGLGPVPYADRGALERSPADADAVPAETAGVGSALARIAPNPVRARAILTFGISRPGPFSVRIYDLAGRRAMTIEGFQARAGLRKLEVTPRSRGSRLDSGLYFYEIRSAGGREAGRFVVLN